MYKLPIHPASLLIFLAIIVWAFPSIAVAKCPDVSDIICFDMSLVVYPNPLVPGQETKATALWVDERTGNPITNMEWLSERGSTVYLWLWDHKPSPDELQTHNVVSGMNPPPQMWVSLRWDDGSYHGEFTLPDSRNWHYRLSTSTPALASGIYSGPVYPLETSSGTIPWVWISTAAVLAILTGLALWFTIRWKSKRLDVRAPHQEV